MKAKLLQYDCRNMSAAKVGSFGFKNSELANLGKKLPRINNVLEKKSDMPEMSFRKLPYDLAGADIIQSVVRQVKRKFDTLVVVGIGGSDLGAKALVNILHKNAKNIFFTGDTTDPQALQGLLDKINIKKTLFYVVSKSGETLETAANFLFWRDRVIKAVGPKKHREHFLITTNPQKGKMLQIAQNEGYPILAHYPGGGRFSVLSVNGLLPAAWAGLDIKQLLKGAQAIDKLCKQAAWPQNLPFIMAAYHYLGYKKSHQNIAVLMPYLEALNYFSFWYRQLWAESLGKKYDNQGKVVSIGLDSDCRQRAQGSAFTVAAL